MGPGNPNSGHWEEQQVSSIAESSLQLPATSCYTSWINVPVHPEWQEVTVYWNSNLLSGRRVSYWGQALRPLFHCRVVKQNSSGGWLGVMGYAAPFISWWVVPGLMNGGVATGNTALWDVGCLEISVKLKNCAPFPQIAPPSRGSSLLHLHGVVQMLFGCRAG